MSETTERTLTPAAAARMCPCELCWSPSGTPSQRSPEGDHLLRYCRAYRKGLIQRPEMTAVLSAVEVVTKWRIVPAGAVTS